MPALQYVPADEAGWLVMVTSSAVLFLEAGARDDVAASQLLQEELWAAVSSEAPAQLMLDVLTRGGISSTPHFALLTAAGDARQWQGRVQLVVRGAVSVSVESGGVVEKISGQGTTTWKETSFEGATSFVVEPEGGAVSPALVTLTLPLVGGAAFARRLIIGTTSSHHAPVLREPAVQEPAVREPAVREPAVQEPAVQPAPIPQPDASDIDDKTISLKALAEAARARGGDHDGKTVIGVDDAARHAAREARAERFSASLAGGSTAESEELSEETFVIQRGAHTGRPDGAVEAPTAGLRPQLASMAIVFSSGATEILDQTILIGRAPSVSKVSGTSLPRLVTLSGPDQDISRNHVQVAFEGGTVVVTDLHSRNGTLVNLPGRAPLQLRAGEPTPVIAGTLVDLGGGVTFTVRAL